MLWLIRIGICASFLYEGYTKITCRRFQYDFFVQFLRYPKEFMIPIGLFELVFAILCIVKPSAGIVMLHFDMGLYAHSVFFRVRVSRSFFFVSFRSHTQLNTAREREDSFSSGILLVCAWIFRTILGWSSQQYGIGRVGTLHGILSSHVRSFRFASYCISISGLACSFEYTQIASSVQKAVDVVV